MQNDICILVPFSFSIQNCFFACDYAMFHYGGDRVLFAKILGINKFKGIDEALNTNVTTQIINNLSPEMQAIKKQIEGEINASRN